jgi:tight adherence protein C
MKPKMKKNVRMRMKLIQAGYRRHSAPYSFSVIRPFAAFCSGFFLAKVFLLRQSNRRLRDLRFCSALALLPNLWLKIKTSERQEKILEGFPDALDLMVVCVEAGLGLDAAINRVGEEMKLRNALISEEFRLLGLEMRAGKLRRDALHNLGLRTGLEEVKSLMTLLIQTDKLVPVLPRR